MVGANVDFSRLVVPSTKSLRAARTKLFAPTRVKKFRMRPTNISRRTLDVGEDRVPFVDRLSKNRVYEGSGRSGQVNRFINRRVGSDPHFVKLVKTNLQNQVRAAIKLRW